MNDFLNSADGRGTSKEIMESILYVADGDETEAVRIWGGPTESEEIAIWERVTKNGLIDSSEFCWGESESRWASDIEDKNYDPSQRDDFEYVCENALNSVSREELSEDEWESHKQWVIQNWEDLNA